MKFIIILSHMNNVKHLHYHLILWLLHFDNQHMVSFFFWYVYVDNIQNDMYFTRIRFELGRMFDSNN